MNNLIKAPVPERNSSADFDPSLRPTQDTYDAFQKAYDEANYVLFEGKLPNCLITLQRRAQVMGYFSPGRFSRGDGRRTDELAFNPVYFRECALIDTLSVLVHEMIHVWQEHFGKPGRGRYHNREFAEKSKSLGLQPSDTGQPGGAETGDRMSHYIIEGGPFERFALEFIERGFEIEWTEKPSTPQRPHIDGTERDEKRKADKGGKRVKYTCPVCGLNMWGMHGAKVDCHKHMVLMPPA